MPLDPTPPRKGERALLDALGHLDRIQCLFIKLAQGDLIILGGQDPGDWLTSLANSSVSETWHLMFPAAEPVPIKTRQSRLQPTL